MTLRAVVCASITLAAACDGRSLPTTNQGTPVSPSAISTSTSRQPATTPRAQGHTSVRVNMLDACDPTTFNDVLGPGTCVRNGGMQFDQFIATLTRLGFVGPWHFAPNNANVSTGATFVALNQGGETHTFTEVAQFGGGIVPALNELAHVPAVAPECAALEGDDFVQPGGTYSETVDEAGTVKFQCCIHPWMRLEAHVAAH